MSIGSRILSFIIHYFSCLRIFRRRKKIRYRKLKMRSRLKKDEPQHLRPYVIHSGVIRRL
ncbi:hypothetical protein RICGR_0611 [Rickettsiella grylli]|uniref:Uncharacterized protein n=1 Tax=Rickettsiella grylli TaxID=59196 RepID=A8PM38_9COXI|nr:hypothetical protein RICGR_0611 [Rickettsiella grylli]